jgi:hypothetical protein
VIAPIEMLDLSTTLGSTVAFSEINLKNSFAFGSKHKWNQESGFGSSFKK